MFDYSVAVGSILILIYRDIRERCDRDRQLMDSATRSTSTVRAYSECLPARSPSGVESGSCHSTKRNCRQSQRQDDGPGAGRGRKYRVPVFSPTSIFQVAFNWPINVHGQKNHSPGQTRPHKAACIGADPRSNVVQRCDIRQITLTQSGVLRYSVRSWLFDLRLQSTRTRQ